MCNIRRFHWLRELYEADCHKPGIYGSERVWANAWDVLCRAPSRGGRGRRVSVDFEVCFGCDGIFSCFFSRFFFFFERTRPAASMRPPCLVYLSVSIHSRYICTYCCTVVRAWRTSFHRQGRGLVCTRSLPSYSFLKHACYNIYSVITQYNTIIQGGLRRGGLTPALIPRMSVISRMHGMYYR